MTLCKVNNLLLFTKSDKLDPSVLRFKLFSIDITGWK